MRFKILRVISFKVENVDFATAILYCGSAIAVKIPMIKTTTKSSKSVKPLAPFFNLNIKSPNLIYIKFLNTFILKLYKKKKKQLSRDI